MDRVLYYIDRTPLMVFIIIAATLGLSPFYPEPHIIEKLRMLATGTLTRPIDILDLFWHAWPFALIVVKVARLASGHKAKFD